MPVSSYVDVLEHKLINTVKMKDKEDKKESRAEEKAREKAEKAGAASVAAQSASSSPAKSSPLRRKKTAPKAFDKSMISAPVGLIFRSLRTHTDCDRNPTHSSI